MYYSYLKVKMKKKIEILEDLTPADSDKAKVDSRPNHLST